MERERGKRESETDRQIHTLTYRDIGGGMQREQLYETSHTLALNSHEIPSFIDVTDYDETMKDRA